MPMSKYNRENPFMYLLETTQTDFEQKVTIALKYVIILVTLAGISIIGCIINSIVICI